MVCVPSLLFAQTLTWDRNPEPDIAGYRVYRGTTSGNHPVMVDVGNTTSYTPQGVDWSVPQYFVVRAYNTSALVSLPSNQAVWTPPASVTTVTSLTSNRTFPLVVGTPVTWTALATNNLGPVEYRFYLYRMNTWTMVRDYQATNTWTWTPQPADVGTPYYVQVWARRVGSTAGYEAYRGTSAFGVVPQPLQLTSNVDFPTPANNVVTWTATLSTPPATPVEYQFRVMNTLTSTWTTFRSYAQNNEAQWAPDTNGTYVVEAWSRPVGSNTTQHVATSNPVSVQATALTVPALLVDSTFPAAAGKPITFKARPQGGMSGPLQYAFYLYSATTGWRNAQPYGASQSFTWTPTFGDEGTRHVQVWMRSNGSTATYDAWRASGAFVIQPANVHLTTDRLFPAPAGNTVRWTARVSDPTANFEYQFWVYSAATGQWTVARPYAPTTTFDWVPAVAGSYGVRVWARQVGSGAQFDATAETNAFQIAAGGAQLVSLVSNRALPVTAGTAITWTAAARGGTAALQYQFWRDSGTGWVLVQDYSSASTYSWTPLASNAGSHNLQVRVRSAGATNYESYMISGTFSVVP
jgi:hypothetical protein